MAFNPAPGERWHDTVALGVAGEWVCMGCIMWRLDFTAVVCGLQGQCGRHIIATNLFQPFCRARLPPLPIECQLHALLPIRLKCNGTLCVPYTIRRSFSLENPTTLCCATEQTLAIDINTCKAGVTNWVRVSVQQPLSKPTHVLT